MHIHTLRLFRELAYEQNISRVAKKWNYVQSNVTAHLQRLEQEFHVDLFHRHSRGVTLTPQGTYLLPYVEEILTSWDHMHHTVSKDSTPYEPLTIGSINSMAATHLPGLLSSFIHAYPSIDVSLRYGMTEALVQQVLQHECQGAFVAGDVRHSALTKQVFSTETLTLISNPLVLPIQHLHDLHHQPVLVLEPGCMFRERLLQMIHQEGVIPKQIISFPNVESLLGHVRAGMGVAMLAQRYIQPFQGDHIACVPLPSEYTDVELSFIYYPETEHNRSFQAFQAMAQAAKRKN